MRVTRLHLRDFRRHEDLDLRPAAGLTIVRGPNEAGKSTIQQALEFVLFRKADSGAQETLEAQRWGSDRPPTVELEFEADGRAGRLSKTFLAGRGSVELVVDGRSMRDPAEVAQQVEALTGLPGERFFRSTASVRHHELADLNADDRHLRDRLQVVISGADRGTAQALRMLDDAIRRYRAEGPKNPGLLKQGRERIAELEGRLTEGERGLASLEEDRGAWVAAHERRLVLDARLATEQRALDEAERAVALAARRDEAQARYERLRRAADLAAESDRLAAAPPSLLPLPRLRTDVERITALTYHIAESEAGLVAAPEDARPTAGSAPRAWPFLALAVLLAVAALAAVAGGTVLHLAEGLLPLAGGGLLAGLALLCLALAWRARRKARTWRMQRELARMEAERRSRGLADLEEGLRRTRRDRDLLLAGVGADDADAAGALLARAEAHAAELERLRAELRGVLGDDQAPVVGPATGDLGAADVAARRDRAANEAEQARHALADMGEVGEEPAASRQRALAALRLTQPQREDAKAEEDRSLGRVDSDGVDAEAVAALAEALGASRDELTSLERRLRVYEATREAIRAAEQRTMRTAARFLEERMGPDVGRITAGRYERVEVDEESLGFRVWSSELGDLVPASALSRGTQDQLYLAARLGLVSLITQDRRPPLVLDDPFVTFDAERAGCALALIREQASHQGFQVLYLTCSDRYDHLADAIVALPGPTAADGDPEEVSAAPVGEPSVDDEAPVEYRAPVGEASFVEAPLDPPPVEGAPVEGLVEGAPANDAAPVGQASALEAPVEEASADDAPVEETPVDEGAVEGASVEEAPARPDLVPPGGTVPA